MHNVFSFFIQCTQKQLKKQSQDLDIIDRQKIFIQLENITPQSIATQNQKYSTLNLLNGSQDHVRIHNKGLDSDAPGAGTYHPVNDLSGNGIYVLSKNVSAGKRVIVGGPRDSFVH